MNLWGDVGVNYARRDTFARVENFYVYVYFFLLVIFSVIIGTPNLVGNSFIT